MSEITFPCLSARLVPTAKVVANDYNPNRVAQKELDLLVRSIDSDGVTQPVVVFHDAAADRYVIVDGFHRWRVLVEHFACDEIPVVVLDKPIAERMASTIRHNRARGKHQVDLQADLVKSLVEKGLSDEQVADELGMTPEEVLRLKQIVGAARMMASHQYSASYGRDDEPDLPSE